MTLLVTEFGRRGERTVLTSALNMDMRTKIKEITLRPSAPIREAARVIQEHDVKFVLVCNTEGRLVGTVTDGDIRRAILDYADFDSAVEKIMNRNPKVTRQHENRWEIREYMRNSIIRHLPEVDKEGRVVDIFFLDGPEDIAPLPNAVVLIAGGKGTRLRPYTENLPKPLLEVGGKPVMEWAVERLIGQGFRRFYMSVNYLGHMIEEHFGDGSKWGVEIKFLREAEPLGTAGALSKLEPQEAPFIVMNGDIVTRTNFRAMVALCEGDVAGVMGAREYTYMIPYGCMTIDGEKIVSLDEKPTHHHFINAGIYVLAPRAMRHLPNQGHLDMPDVFHALLAAGERTRYFHITGEWIDIGSKADLSWARRIYNIGEEHD